MDSINYAKIIQRSLLANLDVVKSYIPDSFFTVPQAARYLGVGRKIVYQLLEFGQLNAIRRSGAIFIDKDSLDAFRQSGTLT